VFKSGSNLAFFVALETSSSVLETADAIICVKDEIPLLFLLVDRNVCRFSVGESRLFIEFILLPKGDNGLNASLKPLGLE
jgi:hypothetical protein